MIYSDGFRLACGRVGKLAAAPFGTFATISAKPRHRRNGISCWDVADEQHQSQSNGARLTLQKGESTRPTLQKGRVQMKRILCPLIAVAAMTTSALAADMAVKAAPYRPAPPIELYSWSGFYLGGQAGGAWVRASETFINDAGTIDPLSFNNASSFIGGGHAGLQGQWGSWVLGVEGTYNWVNLHQTVPSINPGFPRVRSISIDDTASVVGKAGYSGGPWLVYVKGGWADLNIHPRSLNPADGVSSVGGGWKSGWTVGGGFDYQFSRNWVAGIDANYYTASFNGVQAFNNGFLGSVTNSKAEIYAVTGRLSYLFNWGGPVVAKY
jgi:outer membrane immunogenic protein